ncbi:MAG: exodeoxyribonuclease VII large subunit [candidate division Zixibacteria bacterium]|nr:exodeoxyribonuclease VII large subunit [candidate division Zixibacteria bacterium]
MLEQTKAYTVAAITRMIKDTLEESFFNIWVEGEISNYHHHSSGHRYLSLKDDNAVLKVTIWRSVGKSIRFEPKDGHKVLAYGNISVYEKGGQYQLNCRKLIPVGMGELELAFRQLNSKLEMEGLFDEDKKKEIPRYAIKVGIVTSPTGAAIRDIIQIAQRRNNSVQIVVFPAKVQGEGAEKTIATGIEYFNTRDDIDIIIIGRGGGSLEDLWPFNTEVTVRAIAESKIPLISAVGHEVDFSLSDRAADMRAPTPSAAAELAVWSLKEFKQAISALRYSQFSLLRARLSESYNQLRALLKRPVLAQPMDMIYQRRQTLDRQHHLLSQAGKNSFEKHRNRLSLIISQLEALSPLRVLARGYSVSRMLPNQTIVTSAEQLHTDDRMETLLLDGTAISVIEKIIMRKHATTEEA